MTGAQRVRQAELAADDPAGDDTRQPNVREQPIDALSAPEDRKGFLAGPGGHDLVALPARNPSE